MVRGRRIVRPESWLPVALLLTVLAMVAGCAAGAGTANRPASPPGTPPTAQTAPETQRSIATAIALRAAEGGGSALRSTPSGPRTVAEVAAGAVNPGGLDNRHLAAGKGCDSCHGSLPGEGRPARPASARCLSCHGGSHEALAARTPTLGARNPHKAHTGRQDCDRCHGVHRPFEYSCNTCHTFPIPEKYAAARR